MAQKVEFKLTQERIEDTVTVDEFIALQQGDLRAAKTVVGKFIVGPDGNYLPEEEGAKLAGQMTVKQLKEVLQSFTAGVKNLVPNESSATSD